MKKHILKLEAESENQCCDEPIVNMTFSIQESHICDTALIGHLNVPIVKPKCKCHNARYWDSCPCGCGIKSRW